MKILLRKEVIQMRARIRMNTDPISLVVIAADGIEHQTLENLDGKIVEVLIVKEEPEDREEK